MDMEHRTWEEQGLRAAVIAGDEAAWRALYETYFDSLFRYVHVRAGRDSQRTEEVVQECWMTAVRRIRSFDPARGDFGCWLRGIADRVLLGQTRRWARRLRLAQSAPGEPSRVAPAERLDLVDRVAWVLTSLPHSYEKVLRAKYERQQGVAEIAQEWGRSNKSVESLLSRARSAFRDAWAGMEKNDGIIQ
ncbi:MAG: RNA polymerase sigma factor [Candidatus Hydrogenedentes bacterium]|nr:RNA polymerase sigma factor [Candidatus Hydrogenedentota bacterium]